MGYCKRCGGDISVKDLPRGVVTHRCKCRMLIRYPNGSFEVVKKEDMNPKLLEEKYKLRDRSLGAVGVIKDVRNKRSV